MGELIVVLKALDMDVATGILAAQHIAGLVGEHAIRIARPLDQDQIQPASLDLRLGETAYRVRASFLPGPARTVAERLTRVSLHEISLLDGAVLEVGCVYIVPLLETFALPAGLSASANPKSSTGRLDVFTRVITDHAREFDQVPDGYHGPLYLEVSPRSFPVVVRTGSRLSQVRFRLGHSVLSDAALADLDREQTLVAARSPLISHGISLSIDLHGGSGGLVGYRGKRHTGVIDMDRKAALEIRDFWEPIHAYGSGPDYGSLVLDPDQFYILVSNEAVHVPPDYAAEMVPFDPLVGEFRVHYAGFFDPGFGHSAAGGTGSRAVLEVRSHEVPFILEHGQTIGRLVYEKMLARPSMLYGEIATSNYQGQGLKLSKHFRAMPEAPPHEGASV